jgi:hypothetical protein
MKWEVFALELRMKDRDGVLTKVSWRSRGPGRGVGSLRRSRIYLPSGPLSWLALHVPVVDHVDPAAMNAEYDMIVW